MIRVSYTKKYLLCDLINMKLVIEGFNNPYIRNPIG